MSDRVFGGSKEPTRVLFAGARKEFLVKTSLSESDRVLWVSHNPTRPICAK